MTDPTLPPQSQRKRAERPTPTRLTAHSTARICQDIDIRGDITIGAGTVIHPKATIYALSGSIVIGEGCVIEENVVIVNQ
jgi:dynactin 6